MCNPRKEWRRYLSVGGLMAQRPALGAAPSYETEGDVNNVIRATLAPVISAQHTKTQRPRSRKHPLRWKHRQSGGARRDRPAGKGRPTRTGAPHGEPGMG